MTGTSSVPNPTMADVARLAGVSAQTVSRVLSDHPSVSGSARDRVEQAVRQLGYRKNTSARALKTKRTMHLGVIGVGTSQFGPSTTLAAIADTAREHGYATSLAGLDHIDRESMLAAVDDLTEYGVDGIVVIAPIAAAATAVESLRVNIPLVRFEPGMDNGTTRVSVDEDFGARLATRYLLELGHETVWHVAGPAGWLGTDTRVRGWRAELDAWGRAPGGMVTGEWNAVSGYEAAKTLADRDDVSAVFVANDQMALGVLRALHEAGRRVPEEVSVVGFDDIPEAPCFHPPLTTVRLDFAEVGRRCVERVLELIEGMPLDPAPALMPELVVRASAGSVR